MIYLDFNATTPVEKRVADAMRPYLDDFFGNPSSAHAYGVKTKLAVEKARRQIADFINCDSSEIIFTSGGTESNNFALRGIAFAHRDKGNHIITSSVEHPAIVEVCKYLSGNGFEITYLPVDEYGMVDPESLRNAIKPTTILVSIMHANNEVGTIQPIQELASIAKEKNIFFHTDAAQSIGKIEADVKKLGVDLLSIAGHKLYAPKGIGALYIKNGVKLQKLMFGADHEQNLRAGTENVLQIVGLGEACELAGKELKENKQKYRETRDFLHELIINALPDIKLNGHPDKRLPNTLSISFPGVEANTLVARLDNVAVSAGAACHAETVDVSEVLKAMAVPVKYAMGTIRFSTGRGITNEDIESASKHIIEKVRELQPKSEENIPIKIDESVDIKLTHYTHGLGCACKIQPQNLEKILKSLPKFYDEKVLVGTETSDDATVYLLNDDLALVQTLDFFTPIVDDPYDFGAIAAANALSDIYAMGAKPIFGLNIVGFPENTLPLDILEKILKGATDKASEAGIPILGGHTIEDPEPKYGMVVSGTVHPHKILKNKGARPNDVLILTKPLGTGILSTAIKRGMVDPELQNEVTELMKTLNKTAGELILKYNVNACTDVTGFGLIGHLHEMTAASKCNVEIFFDKIPFLKEVRSLATANVIPGGSYNNYNYTKDHVDYGNHSKIDSLMLCDAQTSGGLLIAMDDDSAKHFIQDLKSQYPWPVEIIGRFTDYGEGKIKVL